MSKREEYLDPQSCLNNAHKVTHSIFIITAPYDESMTSSMKKGQEPDICYTVSDVSVRNLPRKI